MISKQVENINPKRITPYLITFCSGKAGVGKSVVTLNTAIQLSSLGKKVLIWDADLHFPNQHLLLGVEPPIRVNEVYKGEINLVNAIFKYNSLIHLLADQPAGSYNERYDPNTFIKIVNELKNNFDYDYILIDTQAGISYELLNLANLSNLTSFIITDDVTSMIDAYGLIKIFLPYIDKNKFAMIVNNVIDKEDGDEIAEKLNLATEKFLKLRMDYIGFIPYDRQVRQSIILQNPILLSHPESDVSISIKMIANNLVFKNQNKIDTILQKMNGKLRLKNNMLINTII